MAFTKEQAMDALRAVQDPELKRDLVALGAIKRCAVCDGHIGVTIAAAGGSSDSARRALAGEVDRALREAAQRAGQTPVAVQIEFVGDDGKTIASFGDGGAPGQSSKRDTPQEQASGIPGVAHIIAVGAGKGGVGKSTVAVNIAVGLARTGHAVGLMDGDIYGPSLPTMMGLDAMDPNVVGDALQPFYAHNVKCMTIGKLVEREKPLIWRGPMAHGAFKQIAQQTDWGELDYLVIDLPPGTGDVMLTMAQLLRLDGAVVVCTPQKVAQDDATRAARMFQQLGVDVLGVVENMSYFVADDGKEYDIFGRGGAQHMAQRLGVPFLGGVPINMRLRANSDEGNPTANFEGEDALASELNALIEQLENQVTLASMRRGQATPELTIR